jgi:hypothetical protein
MAHLRDVKVNDPQFPIGILDNITRHKIVVTDADRVHLHRLGEEPLSPVKYKYLVVFETNMTTLTARWPDY